MAFDVHQAVTDRIIQTLEAGEAGQWTCPWHRTGGGLPRNALTGRAYRGINTLSLWVGAQAAGYADDRWATYKQWNELGAQVKRGEKSTLVVFFKEYEADDGEDRKRFVARASYAFNACQVEGAPEAGEPMPASEWTIPEIFDGFVQRTGARITHGGDAAFYQPSEDRIVMPPRERFGTAQGYASTMAHELTHWSGAKGRLDRDLTGRFKSQAYAAEELVAELGSAFLMAEMGLEAEPHPTHASYLASWLKLLRSDPKAIFTARWGPQAIPQACGEAFARGFSPLVKIFNWHSAFRIRIGAKPLTAKADRLREMRNGFGMSDRAPPCEPLDPIRAAGSGIPPVSDAPMSANADTTGGPSTQSRLAEMTGFHRATISD